MFTETGRSGRLKPEASGEGDPACVSGRRAMMISCAESSLMFNSPDSSAERLQSSTTPFSVIQTPLSSAMVSDAIVAREDRAPSKPVTVTCRPASDKVSSRKAVR